MYDNIDLKKNYVLCYKPIHYTEIEIKRRKESLLIEKDICNS
jgi:hypothetical protein